jgi:hypothetical protein
MVTRRQNYANHSRACTKHKYHLLYGTDASFEADNYSAGYVFIHALYTPTVHYRGHNSLPLEPITSLSNPVHTLTPCTCFSIIIPPAHVYPSSSLSVWLLQTKILQAFFISTDVLHVSPVSSTLITLREQLNYYISFMRFSPSSFHFLFPTSIYRILCTFNYFFFKFA